MMIGWSTSGRVLHKIKCYIDTIGKMYFTRIVPPTGEYGLPQVYGERAEEMASLDRYVYIWLPLDINNNTLADALQ